MRSLSALFTALVSVFLLTQGSVSVEAQRRLFQRQDQPPVYDSLRTNPVERGTGVEIVFTRGDAHNHPLMALWVEDTDSQYVQTLYVAESIGKGVFRHGDPSTGRWLPGPVRRPAALPYWGHQRGIRAPDGYYIPTQDDPVPDAITGPTPKQNFVLSTQIPGHLRQFRLLFEVNQSWDWNEYWTNDKFPHDEHYMSSSQPALVYEAYVDLDSGVSEYSLEVIGHSHWSGQNGTLYTDLSTITTALDITRSITVRLVE